MRSRWLARALPWTLLLVFCLRGLLAMQVDGTTADEPLHFFYGQRALASGTFLRQEEQLNSKMPVSVLNALPVAIAGSGGAPSWRRQLFLARLPSLLLGVVLGWLVWRWAQLLFGPWGGISSLVLYTFCPNFLAHAHLVTTDVATALAMFAATYCLWRYQAAPSPGRLFLAAAGFGVAQLTKVSALFLVPMFALILAARALGELLRESQAERPVWKVVARSLGRRAARGVLLLLVFALAAIAALNLGFCFEGTGTPLERYTFVSPTFQALAGIPVLRSVPLPLPYAYLQGLDMVWQDARAGDWSYLRGRYSQTGFRSYFFWAFLVKVPLATQILLVIAFFLWASGRVRAPGAECFLIVPPAVLVLYLSLFFQLDIGFRYLLPGLPFLFVFAARVAAPAVYVPAAQRTRVRPLWKALVAAILPILLLWLALSSFLVHPHYLAYFNEVAGGPANGWRWLIDSNLDWGQDGEYVRQVHAAHGPRPALFDPSGPVAGRVAVNVSNLVGRDPAAAKRHAWLRDNFRPVTTIGYSWEVFQVTEADLARCCAALPRTWVLDDLASDLALDGEPFGGGDGVQVRFQERLNDGMLGANEPVDAARTTPPRRRPVRAWFGISWRTPQAIGRVVAFPSFDSRGPLARRFLALDYVFQSWDGAAWRDLPGTRVIGNQAQRVEHRFPPVLTDRIRLLIERERNVRGAADPEGGFRAACLELAAYAH